MVLTFTGSISAAESGREEIRTMLVGAIGCNLAWGIIDAVMYLFANIAERGRAILALRAVREASDAAAAHQTIRDAVPPLVASVMDERELEAIRQKLNQLPPAPQSPGLTAGDFRGALSVFLLVFISTFPVVIPFLFMQNAIRALRISNAIAVLMLFVIGYWLGRYMGHRPWRLGALMVVIGLVLVGMTIALGG